MPSSPYTALVQPLGEDWRASIDRIGRAHRWPTTAEPAQLGALVHALSEAYNAPIPPPGRAVAASGAALAARLGFSFTRDLPKSAAAVRELVASGELDRATGIPLRILDIGCGLGATTWGIARALAAAGEERAIEATWTDEDALVLEVAQELARERDHRDGKVTLKIVAQRSAISGNAERAAGRGPWDLILLGQVLSELERTLDPEDRAKSHSALITSLIAKLAPGGAVVVVEPALRERTRHLHAVRDAVLAGRAATVFAPCLHDTPCPALKIPGEWCHEDIAVDLPSWLEPVARAAGLRWQGLTFSYLVLRRPGEPTLAQLLPRGLGARARIISGPLVSKGKREHFVCGEPGLEGGGVERERVSRLDRDADDANAPWGSLARGDVIAICPAPDPKKHRIARGSSVVILEPVPPVPAEARPIPHTPRP